MQLQYIWGSEGICLMTCEPAGLAALLPARLAAIMHLHSFPQSPTEQLFAVWPITREPEALCIMKRAEER